MLKEQPKLTARRTLARAPALVRFADPLVRRLIGLGMAMGPNTLLTIRGRKSGLPRTFPIAVNEIAGRWWVVAPYGEVNWVRNLRAAGEGVLQVGGRQQNVNALELGPDEAAEFFRVELVPHLHRMPLGWRMMLGLGLRFMGAGDIFDSPATAAIRHPVFELRAVPD